MLKVTWTLGTERQDLNSAPGRGCLPHNTPTPTPTPTATPRCPVLKPGLAHWVQGQGPLLAAGRRCQPSLYPPLRARGLSVLHRPPLLRVHFPRRPVDAGSTSVPRYILQFRLNAQPEPRLAVKQVGGAHCCNSV